MGKHIWKATKYTGVRYREHRTRMYNNQPDRYYTIRLKAEGREEERKVGWASEGVTPEQAYDMLVKWKQDKHNEVGSAALLTLLRSIASSVNTIQQSLIKIEEHFTHVHRANTNTCLACGKSLVGKKISAKYCNHNCRMKHYYQTVVKPKRIKDQESI